MTFLNGQYTCDYCNEKTTKSELSSSSLSPFENHRKPLCAFCKREVGFDNSIEMLGIVCCDRCAISFKNKLRKKRKANRRAVKQLQDVAMSIQAHEFQKEKENEQLRRAKDCDDSYE